MISATLFAPSGVISTRDDSRSSWSSTARLFIALLGPLAPVPEDLLHDLLDPDPWLPAGRSFQPAVFADENGLARRAEPARVDLDFDVDRAVLLDQLDDVADPGGLAVAEVVDLAGRSV